MSDLQEAEVLRCRIKRSIEDNENQATDLIQFSKHYIHLEKIVEKVSNFSLTFAHAGFYINETITSVNEYIQYYKET